MSDRRRNGFILLVVLGFLAASIAAIGLKNTRLGLDLKGGVELVYEAKPTPQQPTIDNEAIDRSLDIMRERVDTLGVSEPEIQRCGGEQICVGLPGVPNAQRAIDQVGTTAQLFFYDWEPNVIGPDGRPAPDDDAVTGGVGAGSPGAGIPLYDAVERAAKRKDTRTGTQSPSWYLLNTKARTVVGGPAETRQELFDDLERRPRAEIPPKADRRALRVPTGTIIVKAEESDDTPEGFEARYYVLNDAPALKGTDIKDPEQQSDPTTNQPVVAMEFTSSGRKKFQAVTRAIAQRGIETKAPGEPDEAAYQHFAIVLDDELVSVPHINYNENPDGIDGRTGAQISGGFTVDSAQDLAEFLRIGALPVRLELISQSQVSATLGQQALDEGLTAGIVGFVIVALFLLLVYRVLGAIAVAALGLYAAYFFAMIKLIPVTLTLPGIAGLILTIGVAADANIVIFERVKEEVRSGRSIPAGITAGYKKGFSAIIDANVVTLLVAFILFVLATAGVKGFAFTLGIGVLVSLFTAVLATQAILGTMSRSPMLRRPSALGAGPQVHKFRFDYMGASKWFFSMSGVILLIGALAIGGKGVDFGIDFESGTRIKTPLERPASVDDVRAVMEQAGFGDAKIQEVDDDELGANVVQISTPTLEPDQVQDVRNQLDERFGVGDGFSNESIGPTFGATIAESATIAVIASLLVISAYIALRFEWKYAVPVLIALMHDLLITAGVYSLADREVTASTVAALLTILGFSLYDTIIVFDRIRENVPRMPRATFAQIVNRSMSEVLLRSLATSFCTALPVLALLLFGGETLQDFAFALLVGTISGTYSSVFIAGPVLTHWKEREPVYAQRVARIKQQFGGVVPAYADSSQGPIDVEPEAPVRRRGRVTQPDRPEEVSAGEFQEMVAEIQSDVAAVQPPSPSTPTRRAPRQRADRPAPPPPPASGQPPAASGEGDAQGDEERTPKSERKQKRPRNRRHGRAR